VLFQYDSVKRNFERLYRDWHDEVKFDEICSDTLSKNFKLIGHTDHKKVKYFTFNVDTKELVLNTEGEVFDGKNEDQEDKGRSMACHEGNIVTFAQSATKISLLKPSKNDVE